MLKFIHKIIIIPILSFAFITSQVLPIRAIYAAVSPSAILPEAGTLLEPTPNYYPAIMHGISLYPDNPLQFDFIIDSGDDYLKGEAFSAEATKLIKYFMAALTVPDKEQWVNLSPYEKDRIIPKSFGITAMGRDLLSQDYLLKQLTASLIYPESEWGEEFWENIYAKAYAQYGTTDIPVDTFNKVWIIPHKAVVHEKDNSVFVVENYLKVLLEEDYLALKERRKQNENPLSAKSSDLTSISSQIIKELIIPIIEKEVNKGKSFANLRQVYNSMLLATWYKRSLKESLLNTIYSDQNKITGIDLEDKHIHEKIYQQYLAAFKEGVFNYIKEDYDFTSKRVIERKYFSGGTHGYNKITIEKTDELPDIVQSVDNAMDTQQPARDDGRVLTVTASLFEVQFRQALSHYISSLGPNEIFNVLSELRKEFYGDERTPTYAEDLRDFNSLGVEILNELQRSKHENNPMIFKEKMKNLRPKIDQVIKNLPEPVVKKMISLVLDHQTKQKSHVTQAKQSQSGLIKKETKQQPVNPQPDKGKEEAIPVKELLIKPKPSEDTKNTSSSSVTPTPFLFRKYLRPIMISLGVMGGVVGLALLIATATDDQTSVKKEVVSPYWYSAPVERSNDTDTQPEETDQEEEFVSLEETSKSQTTSMSADGEQIRKREARSQSGKVPIVVEIISGEEYLEPGETFFTSAYSQSNGGKWSKPVSPQTTPQVDTSEKLTFKVQIPALKAGQTTNLLWNLKWTPTNIDDSSARVQLVDGYRLQAVVDIQKPYTIEYNLFPALTDVSLPFASADQFRASNQLQRELHVLNTNPHLEPIRNVLGNPSSFSELKMRLNQVAGEYTLYNPYFNFVLQPGDTLWGAFVRVISTGEKWRGACNTTTGLLPAIIFPKYGYPSLYATGWMYQEGKNIAGDIGHVVTLVDTKSKKGLVVYDVTKHMPQDPGYDGQFTKPDSMKKTHNKQTDQQSQADNEGGWISSIFGKIGAALGGIGSTVSEGIDSAKKYFQQWKLTSLTEDQDAQGLEAFAQEQDNFSDLRQDAVDALAEAGALDNLLNIVIDENSDTSLRQSAFNALKTHQAWDQMQAIVESDSVDSDLREDAFLTLKGAGAYENLRNIALQKKNYHIPMKERPNDTFQWDIFIDNPTVGRKALQNIPRNYEHINLFLDIAASENAYPVVRYITFRIVENIIDEESDRIYNLNNKTKQDNFFKENLKFDENLKDIFMSIINSYESSQARGGTLKDSDNFNTQILSESALEMFLDISTSDEQHKVFDKAKEIILNSNNFFGSGSHVYLILVKLNLSLTRPTWSNDPIKNTFAHNFLDSLIPWLQKQILRPLVNSHAFWSSLEEESLASLVLLSKEGNINAQQALLGKEAESKKRETEQSENIPHGDMSAFPITEGMRKVLNENGLALHSVNPGEKVSVNELAYRYGVDTSAIQALNPVFRDDHRRTTYHFEAGTTIFIPNAAAVTHLIREGKDTYSSLSERYYGAANRTNYQRIQQHNGLAHKKYLPAYDKYGDFHIIEIPMSKREYRKYERKKTQEEKKRQNQSRLGDDATNKDNALVAQAVTQRTDSLDATNPVGGIDFNQKHLNLQIRRDGKGVPLPLHKQPLNNIQVNGFIPVILRIQPFIFPGQTPVPL